MGIIVWVGLLVALLALFGWSWFLVQMSMAFAAQATGMQVLERMDARIDERIASAVARLRPVRVEREPEGPVSRGTTVLDDAAEAVREARRPTLDLPPMAGEYGLGVEG